MIELMISDAHGPGECQLAAQHLLATVLQAAHNAGLAAQVREQRPAPHGIHSAIITLRGEGATAFAHDWAGTVQWQWQSRLRPRHARKNWFIGIHIVETPALPPLGDIRVQTCKARGKGGQHVNKTRSAVRVTDINSGLSVKIDRERSQHANKRQALAALAEKHNAHNAHTQRQHAHERHRSHWQVARGGAVKVFIGDAFLPKK